MIDWTVMSQQYIIRAVIWYSCAQSTYQNKNKTIKQTTNQNRSKQTIKQTKNKTKTTNKTNIKQKITNNKQQNKTKQIKSKQTTKQTNPISLHMNIAHGFIKFENDYSILDLASSPGHSQILSCSPWRKIGRRPGIIETSQAENCRLG